MGQTKDMLYYMINYTKHPQHFLFRLNKNLIKLLKLQHWTFLIMKNGS